jgi:hypothetical protein
MKNLGLPLKLAIGILVVFGLLFVGMGLYPTVMLKIYKSQLESKNDATRWKAFKYLCNKGKSGINIIDKFCRACTENDWGEINAGLRIKISLNANLFEFESEMESCSTKMGFSVTFQNLRDEAIKICIPSHSPTHLILDHNTVEFIRLETVIRKPPIDKRHHEKGGYGYSHYKMLGAGEEYTQVYRDSEILSNRKYQPGIYILRVNFNSVYTLDGLLLKHTLTSNSICFAVFPGKAK